MKKAKGEGEEGRGGEMIHSFLYKQINNHWHYSFNPSPFPINSISFGTSSLLRRSDRIAEMNATMEIQFGCNRFDSIESIYRVKSNLNIFFFLVISPFIPASPFPGTCA